MSSEEIHEGAASRYRGGYRASWCDWRCGSRGPHRRVPGRARERRRDALRAVSPRGSVLDVPGLRATHEQIRETAAADCKQLARSLADAFMDDPVACWAAPRESLRRGCLRRFFGAYLAIRVPMGLVWNDSDLVGAALWAPPGKGVTAPFEALRLAGAGYADPRLWLRGPLVGYGLVSIENRHPKTPDHLYLATLGVTQSEQGRGLGSLLLGPALELCDRDGLPAYLEASKEHNISFYARHGFRVTREIKLPRGPTMYAMWREPHR